MAVREVARILRFIHVVWTSKVLSASFFVFVFVVQSCSFRWLFCDVQFLCFLLSSTAPNAECRKAQKKKRKTRLWTSFVSSTILTQNVTKIKTNHHHHVCTRVRLVLVLRPVGRRSRVDIVQQEEICIQGLCKC